MGEVNNMTRGSVWGLVSYSEAIDYVDHICLFSHNFKLMLTKIDRLVLVASSFGLKVTISFRIDKGIIKDIGKMTQKNIPHSLVHHVTNKDQNNCPHRDREPCTSWNHKDHMLHRGATGAHKMEAWRKNGASNRKWHVAYQNKWARYRFFSKLLFFIFTTNSLNNFLIYINILCSLDLNYVLF